MIITSALKNLRVYFVIGKQRDRVTCDECNDSSVPGAVEVWLKGT